LAALGLQAPRANRQPYPKIQAAPSKDTEAEIEARLSEAPPVKAKHTMVAGKKVDKYADREILNHRPIAMK
jgi:hypothetical protein